MKTKFSSELFDRFPVVGILRGFASDAVKRIIDASLNGGLTNLEITMNTPDAAEQIREARTMTAGRMNIGAGTVVGIDALERALDSGAMFIVTPVVEQTVIQRCRELGVPVFPGAFTPTEIVRAWELGATMVKLFPAEALGAGYIKSLKAPLPQVRLMPTGGVDVESLEDYLRAGADGFGVGSPLFNKDRVAAGDWKWIENRCRAFAEKYAELKRSGI